MGHAGQARVQNFSSEFLWYICKDEERVEGVALLDKAMAEKNWTEVAMVRGKLQTMIYKDNRGFVIRSRFKENQEVE